MRIDRDRLVGAWDRALGWVNWLRAHGPEVRKGLVGDRQPPRDLLGEHEARLKEAIRTGCRTLVECTAVANRYEILISPEAFATLQEAGWRQVFTRELRRVAVEEIRALGLDLLGRPLLVSFRQSEDVAGDEVEVDFDYDPPEPYLTLEVRNGAARGQDFPIGPTSPCTLGRGPENDLEIPDTGGDPEAWVSRAQVCLRRTRNDGWAVEDLKSRHGTWIGGERITPGAAVELKGGEALRLGGPKGVEILVHRRDPSAGLERPAARRGA